MALKRNASDTKYRRENTKRITIRFFLNTDDEQDVYDFASSKENTNSYIKQLIREDMERGR